MGLQEKIMEIFLNAGMNNFPDWEDDYLKTVYTDVLAEINAFFKKAKTKAVFQRQLSTSVVHQLCKHPSKENCNIEWCRGNTEYCRKKMGWIELHELKALLTSEKEEEKENL